MSSEKRPYELKKRAEQQAETRQRIVSATADLHQEVGPARTTVSEIARRAGVGRPTVYAHFPGERELIGACSAHWRSEHPRPDLAAELAEPDPAERVRRVLEALYASYAEGAPMTEKILRDRTLVPALDDLLRASMDPEMARLGAVLAAGFGLRGAWAKRLQAMIAVALDFWTWKRLDAEGLGADEAAALMAEAVSCLGG